MRCQSVEKMSNLTLQGFFGARLFPGQRCCSVDEIYAATQLNIN